MHLLQILPPAHIEALYNDENVGAYVEEQSAHIGAKMVDNAPAVEMVHKLNRCHIARRYIDMETRKRSH
jgi:hypothetical protein